MLPEIIKLSVQNNQTMCPFTIGDQNGFILNFTFTCFLLGQGGTLYIFFRQRTNFYLVYAVMIL